MNTRAPLFALALALPLFAACEHVDVTSADPNAEDSFEAILASSSAENTDPRAPVRGGHSLFDRLAGEIPEFGGLFRYERCTIGLVLTDLSHQDRAEAIVIEALTSIVGRACADGIDLVVHKGDFTYVELMRYLTAAHPLLNLRGVRSIAVDFKQNRLVVAIASHSVAAAVLDALERVGVPAEAVIFTSSGRG